MGWEALFADLEGEFDAAEAAERAAEIDERTRLESARVQLADRLRANLGQQVALTVAHLGPLTGVLADVGPDWVLVTESRSRQSLIPLVAVVAVAGLGGAAEPLTEGGVAGRLRLGYALRAVARDRMPVTLVLVDGSARTGTIDRVGADHVTVAEHAIGEARRAAAVRDVVVVPFEAIAAVRST